MSTARTLGNIGDALTSTVSTTNVVFTSNVGIGTSTVNSGNALAVYGGNVVIGTTNNGLKFPDGTMQTTAATAAGPTFAAYMNAAPSLSGATKLPFDTTYFNIGSCYNTSTYRFTPTTAGYYQVSIIIRSGEGNSTAAQHYTSLYKNGSRFAYTQNYTGGQPYNGSISGVIYFNGSTDYIEAYFEASGGTPVVNYGINAAMFSAGMIRGV